MRRILSVMLLIFVVLSLSACGTKSNRTYQSPANFYYCTEQMQYNSADGVIHPEVRESEGFDTEAELAAILNLYFQGPEDDSLRSPFPEGVSMKRCAVNGNVIQVILSNHISQLEGYDLTIACACLTKTLLELTPVDFVEIRAEGGKMGDSISVTMSNDTLLLLDNCSQSENSIP